MLQAAIIIQVIMRRFLIADDHFIVRTGISMLIQSEFLDAEIEECADGDSVWRKMEREEYDLAILDLSMPGMDSVSLLRNVFAHHPLQKVLILSISPEEIYAKKYLQLGVKGFINKDAEGAELRRAITSIVNNKRYLSPRMQDILAIQEMQPENQNPFDSLSARELEVLTHILEGKTITEIAKALSVHTSTAGTHKARILQKLGVSNVIELNRVVQLFKT
jgi:DNA-binding NarL/FixJ family response regulator